MKKHFKLYKSGKLWVTAAVAVLSFAVSANLNQASASDNT
ncbi:MAG: KxYKxGKxW signal peptide domain-containing protein, partial [Limosilactobacillus sp.]